MLTTTVAGRVFDFSHVVGGRQITGVVSLAMGHGDDVFIVKKAALATDVQRLSIGDTPGDEEIAVTFSEVNEGLFDGAWPACVAVSPDGKVYVTDELQSTVMRFDRDGRLLSRLGGPGHDAGQFDRPSGIVFDGSGQMFVADTLNHRIQKFDPEGSFMTAWGEQGGGESQFRSPWGITADEAGNVYVADHGNHRVQKFTGDGRFLVAWGDRGPGQGEFDHPTDVAVDPAGDIYVCDWVNSRVQVFNKDARYIGELHGSAHELSKWQEVYVKGNPDVYKARRRVPSLELESKFALPTAVDFDARRSRLLVVDSQRWRIQIFDRVDGYSQPQFNI